MAQKLPPFLKDYDSAAELHRTANNMPAASVSYFANYLAQILRIEWRYEPFLKQWFHFDDQKWAESESVLTAVSNMILQVMQSERWLLHKPDTVFSQGFATGVKKLLESDDRIQIRIQNLDTQFELLNTPNGTIDLKTGQMSTANPDHLISKTTNVIPLDDEDGAKCPHYLEHLRFISDSDIALIQYFELFSGYCLTGHVFLQEFYTWCGFGANGKSMLYKIWHHIMGDYAGIAASGQFSVSGRTAHKEQDLRLAGKRLVVSEEISGWDLDKLKHFTDGGQVSAREMHGKTSAFIPQCKLLFLTNNPPKLNSVDYGVERRLKLITFTKRIEESMRNPMFLEECLIPEAPYILHRMIQHAVQFLAVRKLDTPKKVQESSKEYFDSENIIQQFIEDTCKTAPDEGVLFGDFYDKFSAWCMKQGYDSPSKHKIGRQLSNLGFKRSKERERRYMGITWNEDVATTYLKPYAEYSGNDNWG